MRICSRATSAVLLLAVAGAYGGWEFTSVTKSGDGTEGAERVQMTVHAFVDGEKARIEFKESRQPMTQSGAYFITTDGGKTTYLVNPKDKTYTKWDLEQMMGMAGAITKMMNMKVTSPKVEKVLEERGDKICGFPTTHYRYRVSYGMEMSFMGMKSASSIDQDQDIWATREIEDPAMGVWLRKQNIKTGDEGLDKLIRDQQLAIKGFPLRQVITQRTTDQQGKEQVMKTTMEVTEVKKANPPAALFQIPEGYQETTLGDLEKADTDEAGKGKEGGQPPLPFLKMFQGQKKPPAKP